MNTLVWIIFGVICPIILFIIGVLFIYLGKKIPSERRELEKRCTSSAVGYISRLEKEEVSPEIQQSKKRYLWIPYVFFTVQGFDYERPLNRHGYGYFTKDEKVTVHYNPSNPEQIYVDKDDAPDTIGRYFVPAGVMMILISVLISVLVNVTFIIIMK